MSLAATMDEPIDEPSLVARAGAIAAGLCALVVVLIGGWLLLQASSEHAVDRIRIEAPLRRVDAETLRLALQPVVQGRLVALDLELARHAVEALPWVARARIEREWPDTVRVRVWEREPYARWGEEQLLDTEARSFRPAPQDIPEDLLQLAGPDGRERELMDTYRRLAERLADGPFALQALNLDVRGEWSARTGGGVELRFGRGDPGERVDTLMGPAARALADRLDGIAYIDLRYTNGFSVGWRQQPPADSGGTSDG